MGARWSTAADSAVEAVEGETLLLSNTQPLLDGCLIDSLDSTLEPSAGYSRATRLVSGPGTEGPTPPAADNRSLFQRIYTGKPLYKITDLEGKH